MAVPPGLEDVRRGGRQLAGSPLPQDLVPHPKNASSKRLQEAMEGNQMRFSPWEDTLPKSIAVG